MAVEGQATVWLGCRAQRRMCVEHLMGVSFIMVELGDPELYAVN